MDMLGHKQEQCRQSDNKFNVIDVISESNESCINW